MPDPAVTATANALGAGHSVQAVETALIQLFCQQHNLKPAAESELARHVSETTSETSDAKTALGNVGQLTVDTLVLAFETLVPAQQARQHGAVYTPQAITAFMANETVRRAETAGIDLTAATVLDPTVGCGALLLAALQTIVATTGERAHTVAQRLHGTDINPASVQRARLLLALTCLQHGDSVEPDLTRNIITADALTADWETLLPARQFNIILGNPPYVRYQQLTETQRETLRERWQTCRKGNFNLHFPFHELAHTLADPTGSLIALITPNNHLNSLSGASLRSWMADTRHVTDIVDFGHHRVFQALTYTAITIAQRTRGDADDSFRYTTVEGLDDLSGLPDNWTDSRSVPVSWKAATPAPWRLVGRRAADTIARLGAAGPRLDQLADLRYGIATCRDSLYLLDGQRDNNGNHLKTHQGELHRIEPLLTLPCAKVSSLADQQALHNDSTRVIYPYRQRDGKPTIIDETDLATHSPHAHSYLTAVRDELAQRDKGRKTYAAWYAYARTQGLAATGDKLLTPLYARTPRFLRDSRPDALFVNGCAVTVRANTESWVTLELLALLLNSGICRYYIEHTSNAIDGGWFSYGKTQLGGLTIPPIDTSTVQRLAALPPAEQDSSLAELYEIDLPERWRRS